MALKEMTTHTQSRARTFLNEGLRPALLVERYETDEDLAEDSAYLQELGYRIRRKHYANRDHIGWRVTYFHEHNETPSDLVTETLYRGGVSALRE